MSHWRISTLSTYMHSTCKQQQASNEFNISPQSHWSDKEFLPATTASHSDNVFIFVHSWIKKLYVVRLQKLNSHYLVQPTQSEAVSQSQNTHITRWSAYSHLLPILCALGEGGSNWYLVAFIFLRCHCKWHQTTSLSLCLTEVGTVILSMIVPMAIDPRYVYLFDVIRHQDRSELQSISSCFPLWYTDRRELRRHDLVFAAVSSRRSAGYQTRISSSSLLTIVVSWIKISRKG
jgi:hypothetical protein